MMPLMGGGTCVMVGVVIVMVVVMAQMQLLVLSSRFGIFVIACDAYVAFCRAQGSLGSLPIVLRCTGRPLPRVSAA